MSCWELGSMGLRQERSQFPSFFVLGYFFVVFLFCWCFLCVCVCGWNGFLNLHFPDNKLWCSLPPSIGRVIEREEKARDKMNLSWFGLTRTIFWEIYKPTELIKFSFIWTKPTSNKLITLWDPISVGEENETFLISTWKPLLVRLTTIRNGEEFMNRPNS